ncbi:hypothetical protein ACVWXB_007498 [Streptomyces sp. TE12347]
MDDVGPREWGAQALPGPPAAMSQSAAGAGGGGLVLQASARKSASQTGVGRRPEQATGATAPHVPSAPKEARLHQAQPGEGPADA